MAGRRCWATMVRLIGNCIRFNDICTGEGVHCQVRKVGLCSDTCVSTALVDFYSKCGRVHYARQVFDDISVRDSVSWNVLLSCYSLNGLGQMAFQAFQSMRLDGFLGDGFTFSTLLSSCCLLGCGWLGKQTHGLVIRLALGSDVVVGSSLVDMYAKCGDLEDARRSFDAMEVKNVVSWNTVIVGYRRNGGCKEPVRLLCQMIRGGWKPDELTLASVLSSCADSAAGNEAIQLHNYVLKNGLQAYVSVGNALIGAYAKLGDIQGASLSFHSISNPDLLTWSSMVSSYAIHGHAHEALRTFERMLHGGVRPDGIIFVAVLSACSHAGLVEAGSRYFDSMGNHFRIEPRPEHYACLVDLFARSGRLLEAYDIINNMPFNTGGDVLGSFISSCQVHGNIVLARWAADKLFMLEPAKAVNYKLLSNIYAAVDCWDSVAKVRRMMRRSCVNDVPGCSWTEIGGTVHTFLSGDRSHPLAPQIYSVLGLFLRVMKDEEWMDYVTLTSN